MEPAMSTCLVTDIMNDEKPANNTDVPVNCRYQGPRMFVDLRVMDTVTSDECPLPQPGLTKPYLWLTYSIPNFGSFQVFNTNYTEVLGPPDV
jgi:hypothetical protein